MAITFIPSNQVNIAEALNPIVEALKYRWMKEAAKKEKKTELAKLGITEQPDYQQALQAQGINFQPLQGEVSPLEQQRMASKYSKVSGGKTVPEQFMRYNVGNIPDNMSINVMTGESKIEPKSWSNEYYKSLLSGINPQLQSQLQPQGQLTQSQDKGSIQSYSPEDYMNEETVKYVRGIPVRTTVPKLKPVLPTEESKAFRGLVNTELGLSQNLQMLKDNPQFKNEMSAFNPKAARGGSLWGNLGTLLLKIDPKSSKFATFRAETDKVFQTFRKETTGAQAALAELGWLAPDYPEVSDNPELYKEKALVAIERIKQAKELLNQMWGKNYRTSQLKDLDVGKIAKSKNKVGRFTIEEVR